MAQPIDSEELAAAWRALGGEHQDDGWQTISVAAGAPCQVLAGRYFPGNDEAIIFGFKVSNALLASQLPGGKGFTVAKAELKTKDDGTSWFSLIRQPSGSRDMFSTMAADLIDVLRNQVDDRQESLFPVFVRRIRAWQSFMEHAGDGLLSSEAEVGLFGELVILTRLLESGLDPVGVIDAWKGPIDGLQDFILNLGAIEVKTTIMRGRFAATIGSFDQLEESNQSHLYLAAIRLELDDGGLTLPELIHKIQDRLDGSALALFDERLLYAKYIELQAGSYTRRYKIIQERIMTVTGEFPRLVRRMVANSIIDARYQLDIDQVVGYDLPFENALTTLGAP